MTDVSAIRDKLLCGIPPLSDEECLLLFRLATGEEIKRRKRCERCNATGEVLVQGPLHELRAAVMGNEIHMSGIVTSKPCPACQGRGYDA